MKFDERNIDKVLNILFERKIITRGKQIFRNGAVLSTKVDTKKAKILSKVKGTRVYNVNIGYDKKTSAILGLTCTCPYGGYCKHIVATLLQIREGEKIQIMKTIPIIPAAKANTWRAIKFKNLEDLIDKINQLATRGAQNKYEMYDLGYELKFKEDNSIHVQGFRNEYWNTAKNLVNEIEVKCHENVLSVKCLSCSTKSSLLCQHSYFGLLSCIELETFIGYLLGNLDFDMLIDQCSQIEGLNKEQTKQLFDLVMTHEGVMIVSKQEDFISSVGVDSFKDVFLDSIQKQFTNPDLLLEKISQDRDPRINALLWNQNRTTGLFPEIIEGKVTVSKDRLKSTPYLDKSAKYSSPELKSSLLKIATPQIISVTDSDYLKVVSEQQMLLREHMDVLQSVPQYLHKDKHYEAQDTYSNIRKSEITQLRFDKFPVELRFKLEVNNGITSLYSNFYNGKNKFDLDDINHVLPLFFVYGKGNHAAIYRNHFDPSVINALQGQSVVRFSKNNLSKIEPLLLFLKEHYQVDLPEELDTNVEPLKNGAKQMYLKGVGNEILLTPVISFDNNIKINVLTGMPYEVEGIGGPVEKEERNSFLEWISQVHSLFNTIPSYSSFLQLTTADFLHNYWFTDFFDKCKENDVDVFGYESLELSRFNTNRPSISTSIKSGIDWFDTKVDVAFGDLEVPMKDWVAMIKNKEQYIKLSDGTLGIVPQEWIDKLTRIVDIADTSNKEIRISKYHFNVLDEFVDDLDSLDWYQEVRDKRDKLVNYKFGKKYKIPKLLTATLRDYQEKGYQWLRFLHEFKFGGCLADDMGLGKTIQVISLLAYLKETKQGLSLVVVPNSLLFNWANELGKFCPKLKFLIYHGTQRDIEQVDAKKYDIIITTYGTATSDVLKLKEFTFNYLILDESQAIKNPKSKRNKAMRVLKAHNKLVMTGTPIENNTMDLFGQFNFVNPGMLGSEAEFGRNFSRPIDVQNDKEQAILLKKLIHPFIIRRTKEQVASDLPPKSEMVLYCDMAPDQRKHYDSLLNTVKLDVNKSIEENGVGKSKLKILEALLRLRQICNAAQLVDKSSQSSSTKIKTLLEHIQSNEQHKCLIFSQFVGMLSLIRAELDKQGVKYAYLDGKTRDREAAVKAFQENDDCKVFLISLKAGNTGLNLTEADYVYIVDPWWNPAVEAQAIDRTHRIGQDKHIFAYRMICKNTIEEKIIKLQEKKRSLSQDIIQTDENVFKSLDKDELMSIFD